MKFILGIVTLGIIFGCGIMSVIFGLPNHYIERAVKADELVGTWNITAESEDSVNEFVKKLPDWSINPPWKTITLNSDGTCLVKLETGWLGDYAYPNDVITNNITSCSWELGTERSLADTEANGKDVPAVKFILDYPNNFSMDLSLSIYEENEELILWDLIGDPDDFNLQEYKKITK